MITCNYNSEDFENELNRQKGQLYKQILNAFITAGENFIINAREQGGEHGMGQYEDVTANLRNSVAYFVIYDGEIIIGNKSGDKPGKKKEGKLSSSEIASMNEGLIKDFIKPTGFQLIGIAGMNYASYVESKGYNVISYQADICLVVLAGYLENLKLIGKGTAASIEDSFLPDDLPANFYVKD